MRMIMMPQHLHTPHTHYAHEGPSPVVCTLYANTRPLSGIAVPRQPRPGRLRPADDRKTRGVRHGDEPESAEHQIRVAPQLALRHAPVVQQRLFINHG